MNFFDGERIHDRERIAAEFFEGVGALIRHARAMPARIVTHDPEMLEQGWNLRVPNVKIGAEWIGKHQDRFGLAALDQNVEGLSSDGNFSHARTLVSLKLWSSQIMRQNEEVKKQFPRAR